MTKIFLMIDGKEEGPFSQEAVRQKLSAGQIAANTFARMEGGTEWFLLSRFFDVSGAPAAKPAEPVTRPIGVWVVSLVYIAMYAFWILRLATLRLHMSQPLGALKTDAIMAAIFFISLLKIGAGVLLLCMNRAAIYLLVAAFVFGLCLSAYQFAEFGGSGLSGQLLGRVILGTLVQLTVIIYSVQLIRTGKLK